MKRSPQYPIDPLFYERWSPRAMSGENISDEELMTLFEAARWAPSSYNGQPWRFIYAKKDTASFATLFDLLVEFNQSWCKNAAALIVMISRKTFERNQKPSPTHSFDAGAAWQNLALQGHILHLVVHGMQGFDYQKARTVLSIPDHYNVEAMAAIGKKGDPMLLDPETREKEVPSDRKKTGEIVMEGIFQEK